jgi:hypothetical protein
MPPSDGCIHVTYQIHHAASFAERQIAATPWSREKLSYLRQEEMQPVVMHPMTGAFDR